DVPPAAAQRETRAGLRVGAGGDEPASGFHELARRDAVRREPVPPAEPADAAAERVADDADVGGRTGERREAVPGRRIRHLGPHDARTDPRSAFADVDRHAAHAL